MLELMKVLDKKKSFSGTELQKLVASDGSAGDQFGYSVAVSEDGSTIVVGAHYDDDKGTNSGSAYIFTKQPNGSYLQTQKLTASDGAASDCFGYPVAISGDGSTIVVGSVYDDSKGSAYIFV